MAELVDENVRRFVAICRYSAVEAKDPPSAIRARIRHDLDELIGRELRHLAQSAVVERQDVALRAERVIACSQGRSDVDSGRRAGDAGLGCSRTQSPDIEL